MAGYISGGTPVRLKSGRPGMVGMSGSVLIFVAILEYTDERSLF
jgi:hypothetical protein